MAGWTHQAGEAPPPGTTHLLGVDEAGRGPVLGPLAVAALAVPVEGGEDRLRAMGVRDSKKLAPARRDRLFKELGGMFPHDVIEVPAEDIDALRASASLNVLEARLFGSVVLRLVGSLGADARVAVYLDAVDTDERVFDRHFRAALGGDEAASRVVHVVARHEADERFPVVSAASIIAKGRREEAMARIREELGADIGSGYPGDKATIAFLEKWINEKGALPPHTRASWSTAQRLTGRKDPASSSLDDFADGACGDDGG